MKERPTVPRVTSEPGFAASRCLFTEPLYSQLDLVDWDFRDFIPTGKNCSIHGLHWYPASFPPALVATFLDIVSGPGHVVLDPFCGTGVVPVEAWLRNMRATGLDNNRFAIEIGRAKLRLLREGTLSIAEDLCSRFCGFRQSRLADHRHLSPAELCSRYLMHPDAARWFVPSVLRDVGIAKAWLGSPDPLVAYWSRVLVVSLSSILHGRLSTVRSYHYTYIVDRSKVGNESRGFTDVEAEFCDKLRAIFVDAELLRAQVRRAGVSLDQVPEPTLLAGLAQHVSRYVNQEVDLVLTSPPYFGMNDYTRSQYLSWVVFGWDGYDRDVCSESGSRRARTSPRALDAYFDDMRSAFAEMRRVIRKDGWLALVIGSSEARFLGEVDPLSRLRGIVLEQGFDLKWTRERRVRFRKINNTPYRTENLWLLRRA